MARSCRNSVFVIDTTEHKCKILIWAIIICYKLSLSKIISLIFFVALRPKYIWNTSVKLNWNVKAIGISQSFLCAFAKLRKTAVSFVTSVCPHGTTRLPLDGFLRNLMFGCLFVENLLRKFQFDENLTRITGTLLEDIWEFMVMNWWIPFRMRNVANQYCREHQNTLAQTGRKT